MATIHLELQPYEYLDIRECLASLREILKNDPELEFEATRSIGEINDIIRDLEAQEPVVNAVKLAIGR